MTKTLPLVMVVEDEALIGLDLVRSLRKADFEVAGPFETEEAANAWLDGNAPAVALLDVNLGGGRTSFALAQRLADARVPIGFLTGYAASEAHIDERFADAPRLSKPCRPDEIAGLAERLAAAG